MKIFNKTTFVVGLFMLLSQWSSGQNPVTIGTGTSTQRYPFGAYWGYERSAAIYQASEVSRSGVIDKLSWYFTSTTSGTYGIRIYLKQTSNNNFPSSTTYASEASNAKLVYADSGVAPTSGGWFQFTLDDTFNYSNSSNLQVIVEMNTGGTGISNSTSVRYTSTSSSVTNTMQNWTADNNPPTSTGSTNSSRPNIQIHFVPDPLPDLNIPSVLSPNFAGCNSSTYDLQFQIGNSGGAAVSSGKYIRVGYTLNNGNEVIDSFQLSSDLAINGSVNHTINGISISGITQPNFKIWANIDADDIHSNDSTTFNVVNPNCIGTNYSSDFEGTDGGWETNALWVNGAVNKGSLNNPPSGTDGWITDASNNYPNNANASLYSPYFDFNQVCTPVFSWQMRFITENNWDAVILEASTDFVNWTKVSTLSPGYNNNSNSGPLAAPKFSGNNNSWTLYQADLSAFKGNTVRLRFRFGSDGSGTNPGVAIDDVDMLMFPNYNGAGMIVPDTMIQNAIYDTEISSTSTPITGAKFDWKLDGTVIGTDQDLDYSFPNTGTFTLTHRVLDACGLVLDSVNKSIVIIAPTAIPTPDFVADANVISQFGTVNYTNLTGNGASYYEWYVSPAIYIDPQTQLPLPSVSYGNNTTAYSKSPSMDFFGTGNYDVCLIAENALGRDTLCKTQYILVGGGAAGGDSVMCSGTSMDANTHTMGHIYDPGGPNANYGNGLNCTFTIDFSCYDSLVMGFNSFNLEDNYDFLHIYDGDQNSGTPLWDISAFPNGLTNTTIQSLNVATSGLVTLVFSSDPSVNRPGFELEYEARNQKTTIAASFDVPDSLCQNFPVTFNSTSTNAKTFAWDFTGSGIFVSNTGQPTFTYSTPGTYDVKLAVSGCAGVDTFTKTVVVRAIGSNAVDFAADYTTYTIHDEVVIKDMTHGCISDYQWVIEPAVATFLNGSDKTAEAHATITTPGYYTVKLFTTNSAGTDSLVKTNYLHIVNICKPSVGTNLADMGISRVVFNDIDNSSHPDDGYFDFADQKTTLMKGKVYDITVYRPSTSNEISRKVWIDYNGNGDFSDSGELVAYEAAARTLSFTSSIGIPRSAMNGMVTMRVATSYRNQTNDPCGTRTYGETEDYRVILVPDQIKPIITLNGADTITINRNDSYTELGATATDNLDGNLTPFIMITQSIDTSIAGTYTISYDVTDTAGNAANTVTRILIILPDAPFMNLNGLNPDTLDVFQSYVDPGVVALDFNNQALAVMVQSNLDSSQLGTYTITYTAMDVNGRSSSVSRDVVVVDRVKPTAILNSSDTVVVEVFGPYNDPGIQISDNYCSSGNQFTTNSVDIATLGFKTLIYTFSDCNGNTDSISRVLKVVDTEAPEIHLKGDITANTIRQHDYIDSGYVVTDNYDPEANITVETITTLNRQSPGLYTLQYKATDASGNVSYSEKRFIYVLDNVGLAPLADSKLTVYPNPGTGVFNLSTDAFSGEVTLHVYDMFGKEVKVQQLDFHQQGISDLTGLAKGTYILRLTQGERSATAHVVLQ
ncbi:MAG: DUF5011 domain-containing protein [Bacteroidetes bacterium]|nr:DUF5011 domain-containing protein [Bacteroidota bacterium]